MTPRGDGVLHVTGHSILSLLRNHQLSHPKLFSMPWAGWERKGREGKEQEGCFLYVSVMTQVENVSVVPIAQLNA